MAYDDINALGFVEVRGLSAAIETADSMLKCAQVRLLRQLLREPILVTIVVEGELGACRAAVDAGQASATRMEAFVSCNVIGRPADDTGDFVLKLAEAGSIPFGEVPSLPRQDSPSESPGVITADAKDVLILEQLAGLPGGYGVQSLARLVGEDMDTLRQRLEALCEQGKLVKRRRRYVLADPDGDEK